jgi:hypothetical protein
MQVLNQTHTETFDKVVSLLMPFRVYALLGFVRLSFHDIGLVHFIFDLLVLAQFAYSFLGFWIYLKQGAAMRWTVMVMDGMAVMIADVHVAVATWLVVRLYGRNVSIEDLRLTEACWMSIVLSDCEKVVLLKTVET